MGIMDRNGSIQSSKFQVIIVNYFTHYLFVTELKQFADFATGELNVLSRNMFLKKESSVSVS